MNKLEQIMLEMLGQDTIQLVQRRKDAVQSSNPGRKSFNVEKEQQQEEQQQKSTFVNEELEFTGNGESDGGQDILLQQSSTTNPPKVMVYDGTSVIKSSSQYGSKQQKRSFMSSNIAIHSESKPKKSKGKLSNEDTEQDALDDQNDRELMDLIKTTKLIEKYTSADLEGRDRRSYMQSKIQEATGNMDSVKAPTKMRIGLEKKRKERIVKKVEEAKDLGLYTSTTKHLYVDEKKKQKDEKEKKIQKKSRGLTASIGKYKNGTLHISKKEIENASRPQKGNFGVVKRSFENVNRPKATANRSKKSRKR